MNKELLWIKRFSEEYYHFLDLGWVVYEESDDMMYVRMRAYE